MSKSPLLGKVVFELGKNDELSFEPKGAIYQIGRAQNPKTDYGDSVIGRLFVGFKVGDTERWTMDDLIGFVTSFLRSRKLAADATYAAQTGVFTHKVRNKETGTRREHIVKENSAQVIMFYQNPNGHDTTKPQVAEVSNICEKLAEYLCARMKQESVIVQVQDKGAIVENYGVSLRGTVTKKNKKGEDVEKYESPSVVDARKRAILIEEATKNVRERGIQQSDIQAARDVLEDAIHDLKVAYKRDPERIDVFERAVEDAEKELAYLSGLKSERLQRKHRGH